MTSAAFAVLATLRDVPGVHGSFLVGGEGALVARDLPPLFSDEILQEVGPRVVRLGDAFTTDGGAVGSCVLACGAYLIYMRAVDGGTLCVLASDGVSMPALRMGANLAARRLAGAAPSAPAPAARPVPAPPTRAPAPQAATPARPNVQWRGAVLRDRD